jgi:ribosomal protein S3AE
MLEHRKMDNKSLETLQKIQKDLTKAESAAVESVRVVDPIDSIESSLSDFVRHSFKCVEQNRAFEQSIQDTIQSRLPEANFSQLIKLLEVTSAGNAIDTANLINPFAQASIAKHEADAFAEREGKTTSQRVYDSASKEILQGLTALNQLLETASNITKKNSDD